MTLLLGAIPLAFSIGLIAMRSPERFLYLAVLGAMVFPNTIASPGGTQVAAADLLFLVLLGGWLAANSIGVVRGPLISGNPTLVPMIAFLAYNAMSIGWSVNQRDTLVFTIQLVEIVFFIPLAFASLPKSSMSIRQGFAVLVLLACGIAIFAIADQASKIGDGRLSGAYVLGLHKNAVGSFTGAGLTIAFILATSGQVGRLARRSYMTASVISAGGLIASGSRGSMLGAVAAIVVASLLLRRRRILTIMVMALIALAYFTVSDAKEPIKKGSGAYDSSVVRKYSFDNAVEKIQDHPVLGTGGGTYYDFIPQLDIGLLDPNNMFLLTGAELGLGGLFVLLWLLTSYVRAFVQCARRSEPYASLGVIAGAVALSFFVHFQFDITWTRGTSSLAFAMIGILAACLRLGARERAEAPDLMARPMPRRPTRTPVPSA